VTTLSVSGRLTPGATVVLGHLSDEPLRAKDLAALTGFRVQQANNFVLQLSARGFATRTAEGWVRS
jgi:predicted Rossmann fold nucleotide-binding protein DprA/Smf involved in DNA uptake